MQKQIDYIQLCCLDANPDDPKTYYSLADVLIAIEKVIPRDGTQLLVNSAGGMMVGNILRPCSISERYAAVWDLKNDSLEYQKSGTIEFIYKVLKANHDKKM